MTDPRVDQPTDGAEDGDAQKREAKGVVAGHAEEYRAGDASGQRGRTQEQAQIRVGNLE